MNCEGLEGIARDLLEDTCTEAPVSALALAVAAGFRIAPWQGQGALVDRAGKTIYLSPFVTRVERQHELVAHELGHVLLWEHGLADSEAGATFLAGALLVPRASLDRALRRDGWSIAALRRAHPHASEALIARRITQVRPAVATVFDGTEVCERWASPWLHRDIAPVRPWERDLAAAALEGAAEVLGDGPSVAALVGKTRAVVVARRWWV